MSFGWFLGIVGQHHPLPWKELSHDPRQGGYLANLDRQRLEGMPAPTGGMGEPGALPPGRLVP